MRGQLIALSRHPPTRAKLRDQFHAARFVSVMRGQDICGRRALAQIMRQHGKARRERPAFVRRVIDGLHHMNAGINFWVPLRLLRYAPQSINLGR